LLTRIKNKKIPHEKKEGYRDPKTDKFVEASMVKNADNDADKLRRSSSKSLLRASEQLAVDVLDDYVKLIKLRNDFAKALGFEDFYAYKVLMEEGMSKKELFKIFDDIYHKTKFAFQNLRNLEKTMPGLRKPWNFGYMMSGDFTKEEDQYFQFDEALNKMGISICSSRN